MLENIKGPFFSSILVSMCKFVTLVCWDMNGASHSVKNLLRLFFSKSQFWSHFDLYFHLILCWFSSFDSLLVFFIWFSAGFLQNLVSLEFGCKISWFRVNSAKSDQKWLMPRQVLPIFITCCFFKENHQNRPSQPSQSISSLRLLQEEFWGIIVVIKWKFKGFNL
jgi:hypothetical protein